MEAFRGAIIDMTDLPDRVREHSSQALPDSEIAAGLLEREDKGFSAVRARQAECRQAVCQAVRLLESDLQGSMDRVPFALQQWTWRRGMVQQVGLESSSLFLTSSD